MLQALRTYAASNDGSFPNGPGNPVDALRDLYPTYLPDPVPLAGLSGSKKLLREQVTRSLNISEPACSWVYWPGLDINDNAEIAILWEREPGLAFNGRREPGHAVGFIGGNCRQISDAKWQKFLSDQAALREAALGKHRSASREGKGQ